MASAPTVLSSDLAFAYVACDIPAGMTVAEWRQVRRDAAGPSRRRRGLRLRRR